MRADVAFISANKKMTGGVGSQSSELYYFSIDKGMMSDLESDMEDAVSTCKEPGAAEPANLPLLRGGLLQTDVIAGGEGSAREDESQTAIESVKALLMEARGRGAALMAAVVSEDGSPAGDGVLVYPNGCTIQGTFTGIAPDVCDALLTTPCPNTHARGRICRGQFQGQLDMQTPRGRYVGTVENGVPHGDGKWSTGPAWYSGAWHRGKRHGIGEEHYDCPDGPCYYEGEWANDVRQGHGSMRTPNGVMYAGEYMQGRRHGIGRVSATCVATNEFQVRYADGECVSCAPCVQVEIERLSALVESLQAQERVPSVPEDANAGTCCVCYSAVVSVVFRPCGHAAICAGCDTRLRSMVGPRKCPVCRTIIRNSERFILNGYSPSQPSR